MTDPTIDMEVLNALNIQTVLQAGPSAEPVTVGALDARLTLERAPVLALSNRVDTIQQAQATENERLDLLIAGNQGTLQSHDARMDQLQTEIWNNQTGIYTLSDNKADKTQLVTEVNNLSYRMTNQDALIEANRSNITGLNNTKADQSQVHTSLLTLAGTGEYDIFSGANRKIVVDTPLNPVAYKVDLTSKADKTDVTTLRTDLNTVTQTGSYGTVLKRKLSLLEEYPIFVQTPASTTPNWASLRRALPNRVLYPVWPTSEYVARPSAYRGTLPNNITGWIDNRVASDPARDIYWMNANVGVQGAPTGTCPEGLLKDATEQLLCPSHINHRPRQTIFLVYAWTVEIPSTGFIMSSRPVPNGEVYVHANWLWTRDSLSFYPATENIPTNIIPVPSKVDTALNTPYVLGVSWDLSSTPATCTIATHDCMVHHVGNTTTTSTQWQWSTTDLDTAPVESQVTAVQIRPDSSITSTSTYAYSLMSRQGGVTSTNSHASRLMYCAVWNDRTLNPFEMLALHRALRERYIQAPFTTENVGVFEPSSK